MKLQAIKKACKETWGYYIFNCKNGHQFLSNGKGAWPVEGITLNKDCIPAMFDLDEKQQKNSTIVELDAPIEERFTLTPMDGEKPLHYLGDIYHRGKMYRALDGDDGLVFLDLTLIKPGEPKDGIFAYALRQAERGEPLVACYGDMMVSALVLPEIATDIMEDLEKITDKKLNVFWSKDEDEKK